MYGSPVGTSVEGEVHLSWMQMFPSPLMAFVFILLLFLQEASQGTLPWRGDQWWQCYPQAFQEMRRLARDETLFLLAMPPRAIPWCGDQLLVVSYRYMPMDLIGLVMRPPILQLGLVLLFLWVPMFLVEKPFTAFSGIPGQSISRFHSLASIFCQLLLPAGPLAPSSHKVRYNP
jgi:hypothetical protein